MLAIEHMWQSASRLTLLYLTLIHLGPFCFLSLAHSFHPRCISISLLIPCALGTGLETMATILDSLPTPYHSPHLHARIYTFCCQHLTPPLTCLLPSFVMHRLTFHRCHWLLYFI